jgi:nucleoside-diphosphate-sugar epimerase
LAASRKEALGRTINLGSGQEISIGKLVEVITGIMGREVEIVTEQVRVRPEGSEVERLLADSSLAGELLGWVPQVDLEKGLAITIEWYRKNMDLYRIGEYAV